MTARDLLILAGGVLLVREGVIRFVAWRLKKQLPDTPGVARAADKAARAFVAAIGPAELLELARAGVSR